MKKIKYILLAIIIILILLSVAGYFFMQNTKPVYNDEITLKGLNKQVKVYYDDFGIPHIYAQNEEDAYFALGYVYANDRLFQTELFKRLAAGRLAEILGPELVKTDKYFRTLGLKSAAIRSAEKYMSGNENQYQKSFHAYIKGFNSFVKNGNLPIEYKLLGISREELKPEDSYSIINFIAFGFAMPVMQEAVSAFIYKKYGKEYLDDIYFGEKKGRYLFYDNADTSLLKAELSMNTDVMNAMENLNLHPWDGSNSWVIGAKKSKSGKVILANDTHFAYSEPGAWYEAEISYPGYNFYGLYLPGVPFPVIGHNQNYGWGLTIFPIDNANFYNETLDSTKTKVLYKNKWVDLNIQKEIIKVKGKKDIGFEIKKTPHGPLMNIADDHIRNNFKNDISLWWLLEQKPTTSMYALYNMSRVKNINEFEQQLAKIDIIGLNVMYGDSKDNIAFWATGNMPYYNKNINPFVLLDGASGTMEIDSIYPFSENPHVINPDVNFVATANNDPILSGYNKYFPGHYLPTNRINVINKALTEKEKWDIEDVKALQLNQTSMRDDKLATMICKIISGAEYLKADEYIKKCYNILNDWDGTYPKDGKAPIIFSKLQYYINKNMMKDELGDKLFKFFSKSYMLKASIERFYTDNNSPWWDDITTKDKKETQKFILTKSFKETVDKLREEWGENIDNWKWKDAHILTFHHPFSKKKPMDKIFDVGPFKMPSCPGCPNKMSFPITNDKIHLIDGGPAMRNIIDFSDPENALGIIPTGQSGNVMSMHYDDQAKLFTTGKYRKMILSDPEIIKSNDILVLTPK